MWGFREAGTCDKATGIERKHVANVLDHMMRIHVWCATYILNLANVATQGDSWWGVCTVFLGCRIESTTVLTDPPTFTRRNSNPDHMITGRFHLRNFYMNLSLLDMYGIVFEVRLGSFDCSWDPCLAKIRGSQFRRSSATWPDALKMPGI